MRAHLASLVEDFRTHTGETAIISHRGVRRYPTRYGDLAQLAGRFAAELDRRQIRSGERVVLWGQNSAEWIGAFFGCLLRGVLAVPLDAAGSIEFAQKVLTEVSPKLVVGDLALLSTLNNAAPQIALAAMHSELPPTPNFAVDASVREDAPFQIIFTSGTTSEPKGIVHTHRNVLASLRPIETEIERYRRYERWVHPLRFLHTLPLSHVFGQFMGLWIPAILAAELHFTDGVEPDRTVELIRRERISVLIAVPRMLEVLRAYLLRRFPSLAAELSHAQNLSAWKRWWRFRKVHRTLGLKFWALISGGASLPSELEIFWNQLGFALIQGYGMTETAALITLNHPFRIGKGTIGKALPGRNVKLSETGEILVKGDMVSSATWQKGGMHHREEEWLSTGDLAEQNESGDFRFLGRSGDVIVTSSGLNIHPLDLEAVLQKQPEVRACAVVPCELAGSIEPVCVVVFSGDDAALQQSIRQANAELMEYQQIRRVLRWPEVSFPYTSTGKLLRRNIRQWACGVLTKPNIRDYRQQDALLALISEITGSSNTRPDGDLRLSEDLYLDSLGRVQLAAALEQRMGVELGEEQIANLTTLGELRRAVGNTPSLEETSATAPQAPVAQSQTQSESHIYHRWPLSKPVQFIRSLFLELLERPLIWLLLHPRVLRSSTPIPQGPLLIIANHVTSLDAAVVLYALPAPLRRRVVIAMSGEMLLDLRNGRGQDSFIRNLFAPAGYWLVTALFNVFPLPRLRGFKQSFAHAGYAMDRGHSVLVFPEGTRNREQQLKPFRQGIGLLSAQSRVPILPVVLLGMESLYPGRPWFRTGRLQVRIGDPIAPREDLTPAQWTTLLEEQMQRLRSSQD